MTNNKHKANHHDTNHHDTNHHDTNHHDTNHHDTNHHDTNHHDTNHHDTNHHDTPPDDADEQPMDARIRKLLQGQPVSAAVNYPFERRVFAKVRRRQVAARAALAASLFVLLSAGWLLRNEHPIRNGLQNSQRSNFAAREQTPADSANASEGFAAFASVYRSDFSPVAQLETLENEPRALLRYLDSLGATREQE